MDEQMLLKYENESLAWFSETSSMNWLVQGMDDRHIKNCIRLIKDTDRYTDSYSPMEIKTWAFIFEKELTRRESIGE